MTHTDTGQPVNGSTWPGGPRGRSGQVTRPHPGGSDLIRGRRPDGTRDGRRPDGTWDDRQPDGAGDSRGPDGTWDAGSRLRPGPARPRPDRGRQDDHWDEDMRSNRGTAPLRDDHDDWDELPRRGRGDARFDDGYDGARRNERTRPGRGAAGLLNGGSSPDGPGRSDGPGRNGRTGRAGAAGPGTRSGPGGSYGYGAGNGPGSGGGYGGDGPQEPPRRPGGMRGFFRPGKRRRIPLRYKWIAAIVVIGLIFRRAVASLVLMALSGALHLIGADVHLPKIDFGWPWQTISHGTTTNTDVGPWVLQKIEGISKPALGQANFNFLFTHKVSKSIGFLPCWYASTFDVVGHASATVDLNPGASWWKPSAGHYRLQILKAPVNGAAGLASVTMTLPQPQLPQSANDVTINNLSSKPVSVQHSWTYPGVACGVLIKPQFAQSILYAQAQQIAFSRATHSAQVTRPLIASAKNEATETVR